jgi:hypothetical protein
VATISHHHQSQFTNKEWGPFATDRVPMIEKEEKEKWMESAFLFVKRSIHKNIEFYQN